MDTVYGIVGVVIVMVIVLQYLKSVAHENGDCTATAADLRGRGPTAAAPVTAGAVHDVVDAKEIIVARSQRRVYGLDGDEANVDDSRWAHELMTGWCAELDDRMTDVSSLERIVDVFCERVENEVEAYLVSSYAYARFPAKDGRRKWCLCIWGGG